MAADGTSDDLNLDDLCPDTDTAMLSAAASESEGEETPGPSTPALSENQSIENSEDGRVMSFIFIFVGLTIFKIL